jgi:hypothetical protein
MRPEVDRVMRAGVRVVLVAAAAGLLVLLLARAARSAEPESAGADPGADGLLDPGTRDSTERTQTALQILQEERRARLNRAAYQLLHVGLRASVQASPRRMFGAVRKLGRELWSWRHRSRGEDMALALLEPDVERGDAEAEGIALYESLRERERRTLVRDLEERADDALDAEDAWRAGRYVSRLEALGAEAEILAELRERLAELDAEPRAARTERVEPPVQTPDADEVALAAALLSEHDSRVLALEASSPERRLARAAALHGSGRREAALAELSQLAAGEGVVAETARLWLVDPEIHPEAELDRLWDQVRIERTLGRVGGEQLAREGWSVSRESYGAWQDSVEPLNLALSAPARVLAGWQPEARAFREFAGRYLQRFPEGAPSDETRARLAILGELPEDKDEWRDGRLVLPPARSEWRRSVEPYLIASGDAVDSAAAPLLDELLLPQGALLLSVARGGSELGLDAAQGQALVAALAGGLERGELRGMGVRGGEALAALQRIDAALREGGELVVEPWVWKRGTASDVASVLLHGGALRTSGELSIRREEEGVDVDRSLVGAHLECPLEVACVDRARQLDSALYARIDEDGELRIGATAGFQGAMVALEVGDSGPRTSLVVPLGYWLGVGRWVPVEIHVDLGLDGLSVGPRLGPLLPTASDVVLK